MSKYSEAKMPMTTMLSSGTKLRIAFKDTARSSIAARFLDYNMVGVMYVHPATGKARIEPWANIDFIEELSTDDDLGSAVHAARREPLPVAS